MDGIKGVILCGTSKKGLISITDGNPPLCISLKDNYTILDKQVFEFKCAGVEDIIIIAGSDCTSPLKKYIGKYKGISITIDEEKESVGSVGALLRGLDLADTDLIVRNADVVTDINMKKFIADSQQSIYPATIYVTKLPSPYGIVELQNDKVIGFQEKPILQEHINAGIYYFKRDVQIPKIYAKGKIENTIFPEFAKRRMLGFYEEDVFWRAIKTAIDLDIVQKEYQDKTDKAWGYEKLLVHTDKYMTKELFLREGFQTSFHHHDEKDETMYIQSGRGYVKLEDDVIYFSKNDRVRIKPKTPHSIVALENTVIFEVSTPFLNDTVRINDFYPRDTE